MATTKKATKTTDVAAEETKTTVYNMFIENTK